MDIQPSYPKNMVALPPEGKNGLYYGDNWDILRNFPNAFVDLIYIDPPFNSNRNYNVVFDNSVAEEKAFGDTWSRTSIKQEEEVIRNEPQRYAVLIDYLNAMETLLGKENSLYCYLLMMSVRVVELHRVLKPTGSFYLHCDQTASHYLKALIDKVFGAENFRGDITWKRSDTHNDAMGHFPIVADSILFYSAGHSYTFHPQRGDYSEKTLRDWYTWLEMPDGSTRRMTTEEKVTQIIPDGVRRFNQADMSAPAGGGMAAINKKTGKPNGWYVYKGYQPPERGWRFKLETMEDLDRQGLLLFPAKKTGRIMLKRYLDQQRGPVVGNVWTDISQLRAGDAERLGYPTQKPVALIERIIAASTNKSELILDAFCGCGTTVAAAEKLGRKWIGIDITFRAVDLIEDRLTKEYYNKSSAEFKKHVYVHGTPQDVESASHLAKQTDKLRKEFEKWACTVLGGVFQEKKGADGGQDGFIPFRGEAGKLEQCVIQVKSGSIGLRDAKELNSTIEQFKASCGVLFTIEPPTKPILEYVNKLPPFRPKWGGQEMDPIPRIQIITVAEHFEGKKPDLPGRVRIEKKATAVKKPGPRQRRLGGDFEE